MKRSVAILGPTPPFIRWAIQKDCQLRDNEVTNLPAATFKQLRGLRELGLAIEDGRVTQGVCLHPDTESNTENGNPQKALGFSVEEVADPFGGLESVSSCCGSCNANIDCSSQPKALAGCFGWLATDLKFQLGQSKNQQAAIAPIAPNAPNAPNANLDEPVESASNQELLFDLVEQAVDQLGLQSCLTDYFVKTEPLARGLWIPETLAAERLDLLERVLQQVLTLAKDRAGLNLFDLQRLVKAVSDCRAHSLSLHVELVPGGFSNGTTWTIQRHCSFCKTSHADKKSGTRCACCGQTATTQNEIKSKVLGLRPYVHLVHVFGEKATTQLLAEYEAVRERD